MKVHHIGYLVKNLASAVSKFEKLGYKQMSGITCDTIRLVDICFMRMDSYTVELVSPYDKNSVVAGLMKKHRDMPYHICYESDNFAGDLQCLESDGFTRMGEPCPAPALGGRRVCFLMGGGAGMIEILEMER